MSYIGFPSFPDSFSFLSGETPINIDTIKQMQTLFVCLIFYSFLCRLIVLFSILLNSFKPAELMLKGGDKPDQTQQHRAIEGQTRTSVIESDDGDDD